MLSVRIVWRLGQRKFHVLRISRATYNGWAGSCRSRSSTTLSNSIFWSGVQGPQATKTSSLLASQQVAVMSDAASPTLWPMLRRFLISFTSSDLKMIATRVDERQWALDVLSSQVPSQAVDCPNWTQKFDGGDCVCESLIDTVALVVLQAPCTVRWVLARPAGILGATWATCPQPPAR